MRELLALKKDRSVGFSYSELAKKYEISYRKACEYSKSVSISEPYKTLLSSKRGGSTEIYKKRREYFYDTVRKALEI
jgi:hypothetical protein